MPDMPEQFCLHIIFYIQVKKEDQHKHENDAIAQHLSLALEKIAKQEVDFQERISALERKYEELSKPDVGTVFCPVKIWKVNNIKKKIEQADRDQYHSIKKQFYTPQGHTLNCVIFLNDRGKKNTGIYFNTAQGPFDDTLSWPMKATIDVFILFDGNEKQLFSFVTTNQNFQRSFSKPWETDESGVTPPLTYLDRDELLRVSTSNSITLKISVSP